jgi:hypothetical protein
MTAIATTTTMTVKITPNDTGNPAGKLADAELHFVDGPMAGLKLIGFAILERRSGGGCNVTFPARQYAVTASVAASPCCGQLPMPRGRTASPISSSRRTPTTKGDRPGSRAHAGAPLRPATYRCECPMVRPMWYGRSFVVFTEVIMTLSREQVHELARLAHESASRKFARRSPSLKRSSMAADTESGERPASQPRPDADAVRAESCRRRAGRQSPPPSARVGPRSKQRRLRAPRNRPADGASSVNRLLP